MKHILPLIMYVTLFLSLTDVKAQVSPYSLSPDWYFGQGGRLTFPTGSFKTSGTPAASTMPTNNSVGVEGSTSICFNNGAVALYTNTMQAYNANPANASWANFIRNFNTDGTCAGSSTGGGVAFPDPASPTNAFYLILANDVTSGGCANKGVNQYRFTGTGTTVAYSSGPVNIALDAFAGEAITLGTDGTGGYWVVIHNKGTANTFRVWHYTAGGITGPTDYTVGAAVSDVSVNQSYLKISPCQDKIAYHSGGILVVNSFNRTTGAVGAELRRITPLDHGVGLEFSPDGSRVFYSGQNTVVSYVDIATGTIGTVAGSASWSMQLGPDGNIYTSPTGTSVGIISSPNTTPTYSTMAIPGGGSIFRGLSNIGWLTPTVPNIYPDAACPAKGFTHDFKNYFLANIAESSVAWDFGDGNTGTGASPTHTYTSNGTFTVTMTVTDATCNQTFTNTASVTIGCTLPVEWTEVNAVQKENGIAVTWATSKEENNDYFVIQRSEDGLHFSNIGQLDGRGSSTSISSYEFIDMTPGDGENYYRIVQYDRNKDFSYSNVVSALPEGKISIQVSPNPSESSFDVHIIGGDKASYSVMDVLGRELTSNISAGSKNFSFGADLAEGVYFLRVNTGDQVLTQKLVKE